MANFLSTAAAVSDALQEIVKNAEERLWLISPYLRLNAPIKDLIEAKRNRSRIEIHVVYRQEDLKQEDIKWLESMDFVKTHVCKNLHAKCYLNENEALVTSMNLYSHSEVNNYEMGILVRKEEKEGEEDNKLYKEIFEEAKWILDVSKDSREPNGANTQPAPKMPVKVYCIRCKEETKPFFPKKRRYCLSCYPDWLQFSEKLTKEASFSHEEKYCHTCGTEYPATWRYPSCNDCYEKKYPDYYPASTTESD